MLILEDSPSDAELVLHALRRAGYDPTATRVETEADFRARLTPVPEIILADFSLPEFDALRALAIVQESGLDVPVIVVSGTIGEERTVEVMRAGAADYIYKDRLGRLGQAVAQALDKKARRDETGLAEGRLGAQHATTRVLAEAIDLNAAVPRIFESVCTSMGWDWAAAWMVDPQGGNLSLGQFWHAPTTDVGGFLTACREKTFAPGEGLPGRVWATGEPLWVPDVMRDEDFFGKHAAAAAGLHAAIAFPVLLGPEVVGVIEFLSRRIERPDERVLGMMAAVGSQMGQFIERKRTEEGLRLFRALIDQTTDGIEVIDPATGRYLDVNETACAAHGFTRDEYLQLGVPDLDPLVASRPWAELIAERWLARSRTFESRHLRKDGSSFPVEVSLTFVRKDRDYLVSVVRDITEREQAEADLRLRDRAIGAATQGIVISDPSQSDNPLVYVSPGFERMTGYASSEVVGRNCRFLQGKDTDPVAVDRVREAVRTGEPCTVELLNYRKDGTPFWNELSVSPVKDAAGRVVHWVGVQADVTARKSLEEQFLQAQKMEAFGQLAGGVAHDFNNLLTIISGYSDMLLESSRLDERTRGLVREIHTAGARAALLTAQLLAFSRKQVVQPRVLDLNAVVAGTEKMLARLIGEDVTLTTTTAADLDRVRADAGQVEQVLMNLVVNARDAMPTGGQIAIGTAAVDLDEAYARSHPEAEPGRYVRLTVTDSGCGMTEEVQRHIFEPFFTTKGPGKGTGLGLATVFGIVKQCGGHVTVSSQVGRGTTFEVYLPAVTGEVPPPQPTGRMLPVRSGTETILIVEDEQAVRALARAALRSNGYTLLEAADGAEAVRLSERHPGPIHLLVSDVVMPRMGGRELAERLTALRPEMRVMFVSGYTDDAVVRHGVRQAEVAFLQKPFSTDALRRKVRAVLDGAG